MVNVGLNLATILGFGQMLGFLAYLVISIAQIVAAFESKRNGDKVLRILQLIFLPFCLLLSGFILIIQGWRLDPILMFQELLLCILLGYLVILDLIRSLSVGVRRDGNINRDRRR